MKYLIRNKKIWIILFCVLVCGLILQLSRTQIFLNHIKNEQLIEEGISLLNPSTESFERKNTPTYCITYEANDTAIYHQVIQTLSYLKKSYHAYELTNFSISDSNCARILHTSNEIGLLGSIDDIEQYVYEGNHLYFMRTLETSSELTALAPSLGIISMNTFTKTTSVTMTSNLLLQANGKTFFDGLLDDYSINVRLKESISPLMVNQNRYPMIWQNDFGEGSFVVVNFGMLAEKNSRGLIPGLLALSEEAFLYPIFNSKTFYIDDFPAPIAKSKNELIEQEYGMDLETFYQSIWWSDMLRLANQYNVIYTGAMIASYNDRVREPFHNADDLDQTNLLKYGRELIKSGGEIGYHGYNHQSLLMSSKEADVYGYNAWPNTNQMAKSLEELVRFSNAVFPSYKITSYVPPSNALSLEGRQVLRKALQDLIVIASLYGDDANHVAYIQEFKVAEDKIVEMPRFSSGYELKDYAKFGVYNALTLFGAFSHFVHPDDVISEDRRLGTWEETEKLYEEMLATIDQEFNWLNAYTATQAAFIVADTLNRKDALTASTKELIGTVENATYDAYYILRTKGIPSIDDANVITKIDDHVYLVKATTPTFKIKINEG